MRDTSAAARPADDPDTVLPYDPDDWERRLAEARKRRDNVLRRRAATADDALHADPTDRAAEKAPRPRPQRAAPKPDAPRHAGPEDWRRRLAEARGLPPPGTGARVDAAPEIAAPETAAERAAAPASPTGASRKPVAARPPAAPRAPMHPGPATQEAGPVPTPQGRATPRRAGWGLAALAGCGGLGAGVALTLSLLGPGVPTAPAARDVPSPSAAQTPAGMAAVAPTVAGLDRPTYATPPPAALGGTPTPAIARTVPALPTMPMGHPAPSAALSSAVQQAAGGIEPFAVTVAGLARPAAAPPPSAAHSAPAAAVASPVPTPPTAPALRAAAVAPAPPPAATGSPPPPRPDQAPAPPAAPGTFVVVHLPSAPAPGTDGPLAESRAAGWPVVRVDFTVSRSHLRVYHDGDWAAAARLGARLGLSVRDFVGVVPAPDGLIEVWIAGGPGDAG